MAYEFQTDFNIFDVGVIPRFRKAVAIECTVLFDVDVDADCIDGRWIDCSSVRVTGFMVKSDGEWVTVTDKNPLYGFLEAAFVFDEGAMLDVYRDAEDV